MADRTPGLRRLTEIRSQLVEAILTYLDTLARNAAKLPPYFPGHLRSNERDQTCFDNIRQMMQVVEDRTAFEQHLAQERERARSAGFEYVERWAYAHRTARPEDNDPVGRQTEREAPSPPVPWNEQAGARFPRAVILSDPGMGKTWLLRYEARRLARVAYQALADHAISLDELVLPILVRLSDVNRTDDPLEEELLVAVGEVAGNNFSPALHDWVRRKLHTERCVILLDAWDEVPLEVAESGRPIQYLERFRQRLGQRLAAFARRYPQPRLLLTSRIVGYAESPIPNAQELELIAFDMPQIEAFARVWFEADQARDFLAMLQGNHTVRGLVRIPLMLALMCRAYKEGTLAFPTRRTDLYERCLRGLLRDWQEEKEKRWRGEVVLKYVLTRLARGAFHLLLAQKEQFGEAELAEALGFHLEEEAQVRQAEAFIEELKKDGILVVAGEHGGERQWLFLHRSLHEYLAARALARQANQEGWGAIATLVDKKAWRPEWQQVIILLAGQLHDPTPLIKMLANLDPTPTNPTGDDDYRHRLALAALCLPETWLAWRNDQAELAMTIASTAFSLWWQLQLLGVVGGFPRWEPMLPNLALTHPYSEAFPHLGAMLPALALSNPLVQCNQFLDDSRRSEPIPFLTCVFRLLQDKDAWRFGVAELVKKLGGTAATPAFLDSLAHLLRDEDEWIRTAAVTVMGELGSTAARSDILDLLTRLLQDEDKRVQSATIVAVGKLGSTAARPDILNQLTRLLQDEDKKVRSAMRRTLQRLDSAALDTVFGVFFKDDYHTGDGLLGLMVWNVQYMTEESSGTADRPAELEFINRLHAAQYQVTEKLYRTVAKSDIVQRLVCLLQDEDSFVRKEAANEVPSIVRKYYSSASVAIILNHLARRLQDEDALVRVGAVWAVGQLDSVAATPAILDGLARLLQDEDESVRWQAARTVERFIAQGLRFFTGANDAWEAHHVDELSQL